MNFEKLFNNFIMFFHEFKDSMMKNTSYSLDMYSINILQMDIMKLFILS